LQGVLSLYKRSVALQKDGAKKGLGCVLFWVRDPRPVTVNFLDR